MSFMVAILQNTNFAPSISRLELLMKCEEFQESKPSQFKDNNDNDRNFYEVKEVLTIKNH